jgi:hypothetical protein
VFSADDALNVAVFAGLSDSLLTWSAYGRSGGGLPLDAGTGPIRNREAQAGERN